MGTLKIISASERAKQRNGVKALIVGQAGIGKTSLLKTLDPETTLFMDLEAGDLALGNEFPVDQVSPGTWQECRDLAVFLAGPDPQAAKKDVYGEDHYEHALKEYGETDLGKYETYFLDSLTVASRICLRWAQQQPESVNAKGVPDMRSAYGLLGREMIRFVTQLQSARSKNVIFVCLLQEMTDEFKRVTYGYQLEGGKSKQEIPGIVDEVITMCVQGKDANNAGYRAFVTDPMNREGFPAKDRSGRLDPMEQPDLGLLIKKVLSSPGDGTPITSEEIPF